jgi:hypothetical protein
MYCCYAILDGAIAVGGLNEDRFDGVHDDPIGFVHVVREQESSLRKEGTEWVEDEIVGVIESTFDKDRTFRETVHLRPVFPGINPRSFSCWVRDLNKRIVQFFVCDAEKRSIDGTRHVYVYGTHGRLIENRVKNLKEPVSTGERTVYEYDSIGQKTGARTYNSDGALRLC